MRPSQAKPRRRCPLDGSHVTVAVFGVQGHCGRRSEDERPSSWPPAIMVLAARSMKLRAQQGDGLQGRSSRLSSGLLTAQSRDPLHLDERPFRSIAAVQTDGPADLLTTLLRLRRLLALGSSLSPLPAVSNPTPSCCHPSPDLHIRRYLQTSPGTQPEHPH